MDETGLAALDRALAWGAKQQPPWAIEAVIEKAEKIREFLESEGTSEPLWSRIELLEANVEALAGRIAADRKSISSLEEIVLALASSRQPSKQPPTLQRPPKGGKAVSSASEPATSTTETTPPDDRSEFAATPAPVDF